MNYQFDMLSCVLLFGMFGAFSSFMFDKHLLGLLMSLEMILVMLYALLLMGGEVYVSLVYLTMGVCEGAVGISLLMVFSRFHGSSSLASYSLSRC